MLPKPERRGPKPRRPIPRGARPARVRERGNRGKLRELADDAQSLYVRCRDGWTCWKCGSRRWEEMQAAHLMAKGPYQALRYREDNLRCLCSRCHRYYTGRPVEWREWLVSRLGPQGVKTLEFQARVRSGPHDYVAVYVWYRTALARLDGADLVADRMAKLEARAVALGIPRKEAK